MISPWFGTLETDAALFSVNIPPAEADALLCDWAPSDELENFPRRKAWYCCEPESQFRHLGGGRWTSIRDSLQPSEFLFHNHPDPQFRVPHVTHFESLTVDNNLNRKTRAVAVVSNHGGSPRSRHSGQRYRNRFVTSALVDLYGRPSWQQYRATIFSFPRAPRNYVGEIPGDWPAAAKRELLSQYKVAIALENMNEPNYFTEKMVEAVRAGCVPVYHADPQSKETVLKGARWIDPYDHGDDATTAIEVALQQDLESVQRQNVQWFSTNSALKASSHYSVFSRIGEILSA